MGDMGDYWRDVRPDMLERSKAKRAGNRATSVAILAAAGLRYAVHNDGAHLIIAHGGYIYDFWPGTGLWKMRGNIQQHRGVRRLLKQIGVSFPAHVDMSRGGKQG